MLEITAKLPRELGAGTARRAIARVNENFQSALPIAAKKEYERWRDTLNGVSRQFYSPLGEFYCFAVILDFVQVIFATRVLEANRISLKP